MFNFFEGKRRKLILYAIMVGLVGQIYATPDISSPFFITVFGVLLLGYFELNTKDRATYLVLPVLSGIIVATLRVLITLIFGRSSQYNMTLVFLAHTAVGYYTTYGLLAFFFLPIADHYMEHSYRGKILLIGFIDFTANMIERRMFHGDIAVSVRTLILIAVLRTMLIWLFDMAMEHQRLLIEREEHEKRYARLNDFLMNIYAEVFYLKKSQTDLENAMKEAHRIYDESHNQDALKLAIAIHEIKKDYYRLVSGLSIMIDSVDENRELSVREIFAIISDNVEHQIAKNGKDISFDFICHKDGNIEQCYDIFIVVNNLIVNAMDACGEKGKIVISYENAAGEDIFRVKDNGCGMEDEVRECIFLPGFSTKFDPNTGEMSSGIGLCHVKDVVDKRGGIITVDSQLGKGTEFVVSFPKVS